MQKLTKRFVESIKPDPDQKIIHWDSELKGFGVVVLPSGRLTYCVQYRNADRIKKRIKIGIHGQITAEEARNLARIRLGQVAHGQDIALESRQLKNLPLFKDLAEEYFERHASKKREKSYKEDKRLMERYILPTFGPMKVANITRRDIEDLHTKFSNRRYQSNRIVALLSKIFTLAISWELREDNPVKGLQKNQEEKRDRWLNVEEMERFWTVLEAYPNQISVQLFKFLILTGARRGETMQATWEQIDLNKGVWTKPSHLTKQNKKEHLPISSPALEVLKHVQTITKKTEGYIFPGRIAGQPIKEPKTFWKRVLREANIAEFRIHDLRHTHASHLVSSGLSLSIVGKLLGHTQASTTQRYAHLADAPLRHAAELFGSMLNFKDKEKIKKEA